MLTADRRNAFFGFLAYLVFVVYGSLVPFEFRDYSFDEALEQFAAIRYLDLGIESRADWIANIVLYVPLAFLGCASAVGMRSTAALRHLTTLAVFAFCIAVAIAVEFIQIFFAPRTVSLNDLLAETLGSIGGIALFSLGRWRIVRLLDAFAEGGRSSLYAAIIAYSVLYLLLSMFPYDFVLSARELEWKLNSDNWGWLIAGNCSGWLRCTARQVSEILAIAPLGTFIALAAPVLRFRRIFLIGAVLGLILEPFQLLLASGVSQGLSVLWRGVGLVVGAAIGRLLRRYGPVALAWIIKTIIPFAAVPYLLALLAVSGWFSSAWLPLGDAVARLADVRFIPFYYHYYTTEQAALVSLLAQAGMYAPIGLAIWARRTHGSGTEKPGVLQASLFAAALALPVEFGKLLVPPKHPDFTNLLIAAASAAAAYALAHWVGAILTGGRERTTRPSPERVQEHPSAQHSKTPMPTYSAPHPFGVFIALAAALAAVVGILFYSAGMPWLVAALVGYAVWLWRHPGGWLFVIPALLPALDLSPWTGRLMLDEFDLTVLVTIAVIYLRTYGIKPRPWPNRSVSWAAALLWLSWLLSSARGLWPLLDNEGTILDSSHSPLTAWLVGKGLLWALLFVPLMRRVPEENCGAALRLMRNGLVTGLAAVTLAVLWERHIYVGLRDFENVFRVTGTFASMNTGGAYIEAFIAFAFPALVVSVLTARHWLLKLLGLAYAACASYAMLVTFSRGGYAGLIAGLVPILWSILRRPKEFPIHRWLALAGLLTASIAAAVPVLSGGFAQSRLARISEDLSTREAHWERALGLMDDGPITTLIGMGFGQYPILYALGAETAKVPGTFTVMREGDNSFLRLGAGETVFLDQIVDVEPGERYLLSARIRQPEGEGTLGTPLCEKALLYSFECGGAELRSHSSDGSWNTVTVEVNSGKLGAGGNWPHRSVKLSLHNKSAHMLDVDAVSLKTKDGRELVANGEFDEGIARWLLVSDQKESWHIDQQVVEMYFAQGVLGLAAFALLLVGAGINLWPVLLKGDLEAALLAGSLIGFLTVGLFGSTMDTARLSMLFYLGAFGIGVLVRNPHTERPVRRFLRSMTHE
ncbi:VanZ family protein [Methylocaldum szegediense]|uniref:O-antigen ligase-like membrane protein n=1 Tax=Methylocaldum szegediense TaxID=73780 RepID=A0ABN8XD48_9GAMM|nr:VanZ family protein [Methylocaldum szegediense]CAI8967213.1 O-antigen ligase-like membrane protein [Methylocaldum szegediense]